MKPKNYLLTFGLILTSVVSTYFATVSTAQQGAQTAPATADTEYQVAAILYMQKASEYRALAYQAFNLAKMQLDADADKKNQKKLTKAERKMPRAVVVDIDETMLDNSPSQANGAKNRLPFDLKSWYAWGEMRKAKAIPGAVDFANYAKSKNVRIFYVSNRDEVQKQATIDNLKAVGFPDISDENVVLRQKESSKEARRQAIAQKYRIVMLIGDNLNDHAQVFEKKSVADRFAETDKAQNLFGTKYIVLPNAMYGDWESAIYEYQRLTEAQKSEKRANALELP
ncbi:MAG TPA: 5'-nucleotidase, lipoprotein e(P4) family [Pyrinomonadaceae bacterium]|nr:5'-nucleotidase, lipoprotein e(P4) family [Pyrinomonadaceae bacterium]